MISIGIHLLLWDLSNNLFGQNFKVKIEQILILHLYNNKQITLQGIGTFKLDSSFALPEHFNKNIIFPNDAITFEYDPKVTEDALLIDAIVQHTKKIKSL